MNQQSYHRLISGQRPGLPPAVLRLLLTFASQFYSIVIRLRNLLYSRRWLKTHRSEAVVISIGNITAGGTGKTPLAIWLCRQIIQNPKFKIRNSECAILTRGYKTTQDSRLKTQDPKVKTQNYSDEPAILVESCPGCKVIINPDRVAGAAEAVNQLGAKVLIMDDGFQHRRLARDLDIVAVDATRPFGYGRLLPAGLLREPIAGLKRADAAVITRCDQVKEAELAWLEQKLHSVNPQMIIARSIHAPVCVKSQGDKQIALEQLKDKNIFAFCGIANPQAFLATITKLGANLVGSKIYNDHHHYAEDDIAEIYRQARKLNAALVLTTRKDWTKIPLFSPPDKAIPLAYLEIELRFTAGQNKLNQLIDDTLAGKISGR